MKKIIVIVLIILVVLIVLDNIGKNGDSETNGIATSTISAKFGNEEKVTIAGYSDHAMEPFISRDGQYLFWNNLNDGKNTSLFYASKIDAGNFQFIGEVGGVNGTAPHLDAVASMDANNTFYWVSTRNYPNVYENYQTGTFSNGVVNGIAPLQGNMYTRELGWLIMDAEINPEGNLLYYVNAKFDGGPIPSKADIALARKNGDQFTKDVNSEILFKNINTEKYAVYAPSVRADGLEMSFTRLVGSKTHIYIASRNSASEPFGMPEKLDIKGDVVEAVTYTRDGNTIYYHKKEGSNHFLYKMTRTQ